MGIYNLFFHVLPRTGVSVVLFVQVLFRENAIQTVHSVELDEPSSTTKDQVNRMSFASEETKLHSNSKNEKSTIMQY